MPRDDREQPDARELLRSEEELAVGTVVEETGRVRARKHVETEHVEEIVPREVEHAEVERVAPDDDDSGEIETLADGSVSIPVLEEELVVTKRTVVRERVVIRKTTVAEDHRVEAELRKERVQADVDDAAGERERE